MVNLKDYIIDINERGHVENVFVVKDLDNVILGVSEIEDNAKAEAEEYNKQTPSIKATVHKEKKKNYIK